MLSERKTSQIFLEFQKNMVSEIKKLHQTTGTVKYKFPLLMVENAAECISDCVFSYPQPDGGLLKVETHTVSWVLHHSKYKLCMMDNEVALLFYCL